MSVRPCVLAKGAQNCAYCDEYPCGKFEQRAVDYDSLAAHSRESISRADYEKFIKPYENRKVLDKIRSSMK